MLDVLFNGTKKAAKVVNDEFDIIAVPEQSVEVEPTEQELMAQGLAELDAANAEKKYPTSIGNIAPMVWDPQVLLESLTPYLGIYKGVVTKIYMECPECSHEYTQEHVGEYFIDDVADTLTVCPNCDDEDTVAAFFEGSDTDITTSRRPSDAEVDFAVPSSPFEMFGSNIARKRNKMMRSFAELHGENCNMMHNADEFSTELPMYIRPIEDMHGVEDDDDFDDGDGYEPEFA